MHSSNCLNCGTPVDRKFCPECGQKTDTHRITAKHFIMHDVIHGVLHVDKGILFTLKETFIRPGYAAHDYIMGKRKNYYNIFYIMLVLLGFVFLLIYDKASIEQINQDEAGKEFRIYFMKSFKILLFMAVPLLAANCFLIFRRLKYNFAEHNILAGFALLGFYIIWCFALLVKIPDNTWLNKLALLLLLIALFQVIRVYFQATKRFYKFWGFVLRITCVVVLIVFEIFTLFIITYIQTMLNSN